MRRIPAGSTQHRSRPSLCKHHTWAIFLTHAIIASWWSQIIPARPVRRIKRELANAGGRDRSVRHNANNRAESGEEGESRAVNIPNTLPSAFVMSSGWPVQRSNLRWAGARKSFLWGLRAQSHCGFYILFRSKHEESSPIIGIPR